MRTRLLAGALLVLGCTSADRPAEPTPAAEAKAPEVAIPPTKVTEATTAVPSTPPTPPTVATPPSDGPIVGWWCACYYKHAGEDGPERVTACRSSQEDCAALEKGVMAGRSGILIGSLTHPCQASKAAHPGDLYGGREVWQPSKKAGSWLSVGECRLPGEGKEVDLSARPKEAEELYENETIGELKMGLKAAQVVALLGEPARRGRAELSEADVLFHQDWSYPQLGLTLDMVANRARGVEQDLAGITAKAPSTLKTAKGITIGSTRAEVLKLYGKLRDPEFPTDEESFIAGSIYSGMIFNFENDKVVQIFLGQGAE